MVSSELFELVILVSGQAFTWSLIIRQTRLTRAGVGDRNEQEEQHEQEKER